MNPLRSSSRRKKTFFIEIAVFLLPLTLFAAGTGAPPDRGTGESAIQRGEAIFRSSCQACHSLKYSGYEAKISAENGRKAFGKAPPDLNLMTKARGGDNSGAAYIEALLVGYNDSPEKNSAFPNIAMPPAFSKGDPDLIRKARDVSRFLDDAADPSREERRGLGRYVLGYMAVLAALLYALNRRTWKGVRKGAGAGSGQGH
jgi:hypothetical protein